MAENNKTDISNTLFMKIIPVLLTAAIIWMMTSINDLQVQNVRMEQQLTESYKLLQLTSLSLDKLETQFVTQKIDVSLIKQQIDVIKRDIQYHNESAHGE